jgi:hypothetical protein
MGHRQLIDSKIDLKSTNFCESSNLSMVVVASDAASIEIVVTLLTVELLVRMSGMEQAVPEVD